MKTEGQGSGDIIARGFFRGLPVMLGYFPIGFAFGVLATNAGLGIRDTLLMSLLVYAGSAQLIAVSLLAGGAGLLALTITTLLVNLRHLLMSATLAPHLGHLSRLQQSLFAYQITDETFALHSVNFQKIETPVPAEIFTTNLAAHSSWIGSSVLGAWAGGLFTGSLRAWGLDYALPAMFIALLILQLETRRHIFIALFSAFFSIILYWKLGGHWQTMLATLGGATLGLLLENRAGGKAGDPTGTAQ